MVGSPRLAELSGGGGQMELGVQGLSLGETSMGGGQAV